MLHLPFLFPFCFRSVFRFSKVFRFRFRFVFHLLFRFRSCFHSGFRCRFGFHSAFCLPLQRLPQLEKSGKHSVFTVYFPVPSSKHCVLASEPKINSNTHCDFHFSGIWRVLDVPVEEPVRTSKIREKWKTQCVYCLFSGSELKTLRFGFRTGK